MVRRMRSIDCSTSCALHACGCRTFPYFPVSLIVIGEEMKAPGYAEKRPDKATRFVIDHVGVLLRNITSGDICRKGAYLST